MPFPAVPPAPPVPPVEPEMFARALDIRGMTAAEVESACFWPAGTVDAWVTGQCVPTPRRVAAFAIHVGLPLEWFYARIPDSPVDDGRIATVVDLAEHRRRKSQGRRL